VTAGGGSTDPEGGALDRSEAIDFGLEATEIRQTDRDPKASLMAFAARTMLGLSVLTVLAGGAYLCLALHGKKDEAAPFVTIMLTIVPSMATSIIGYYYGRKAE
jgi:cytochrome bd-type quinol oxidase subunit 1